MRFILAALTFVLFSACSSGTAPVVATDAEKTDNQGPVKKIMGEIFAEITRLKPYMVSDATFSDPKNKPAISQGLTHLTLLSREARHEPLLKNTGFRFSREVFGKHVAETEKVYKSGNATYARWMLNATTGICMSCHEQMASESYAPKVDISKQFSSPFDQAEFYFLSRQFTPALEIYSKIARGYPSVKVTADQLDLIFDRILTIYARIQRNPAAAIKTFNLIAKNKRIPFSQKRRMNLWITELRTWDIEAKRAGKASPDAQDERAVRDLSQSLIVRAEKLSVDGLDRQSVIYSRLSGVLYEYLNSHAVNEFTPQAFYWLALSDRHMKHNFFFSLGDLYLRECIERWPTNPVAKECFREYRDGMITSYSGSRGTQLPDDVQADLDQLQSKLPADVVPTSSTTTTTQQ